MSIEKEYNIVYLNNRRYYKLDLTQNYLRFDINGSTPYNISFNGIIIQENTWVSMIIKLVEKLDKIKNIRKGVLLGLQYPSSTTKILFSETKMTDFRESVKGLYINTKFDSERALKIIKLLLTTYGIRLNEVAFIIKRNFDDELPKVKDYYRDLNIKKINNYFLGKGVSQKQLSTITSRMQNLYNYPLIGSKNNDLLLFDNYDDYSNAYTRIKATLKGYIKFDPKLASKYKLVVQTLDDLKEYFKDRETENIKIIGEELFFWEDLNIYKIKAFNDVDTELGVGFIIKAENNGEMREFTIYDLIQKQIVFINLNVLDFILHKYLNFFEEWYKFERYNFTFQNLLSMFKIRIFVKDDFIFCLEGNKCSVISYIGNSQNIVIPEEVMGCPVVKIGFERPYRYEEPGIPSMHDFMEFLDDKTISGKRLAYGNFKSFFIPKTIEDIVFGWLCTLSLDNIYVDKDNKKYFTYENKCLLMHYYGKKDPEDLGFPGKDKEYEPRNMFLVYATTNPVVPDNIVNLDFNAFKRCHINRYKSCKDADYIPSERNLYWGLLTYKNNLQENIIHPDCKVILPYAFDTSPIENVVLPEGLIRIDEYAFNDCPNIKQLDIPNSVLYLSDNSFKHCNNLKIIKFGLYSLEEFLYRNEESISYRPFQHVDTTYAKVIKKEEYMDDNGTFSFKEHGYTYTFYINDNGLYEYNHVRDGGTDCKVQNYAKVLKKMNSTMDNVYKELYPERLKMQLDANYETVREALEKKYTPNVLREWIKEPLCRHVAYLCIGDYIENSLPISIEDKYLEIFSKFQLDSLIKKASSFGGAEISSRLLKIYNRKYGGGGISFID